MVATTTPTATVIRRCEDWEDALIFATILYCLAIWPILDDRGFGLLAIILGLGLVIPVILSLPSSIRRIRDLHG